jgi:DNA-binding NtrC family response regulator
MQAMASNHFTSTSLPHPLREGEECACHRYNRLAGDQEPALLGQSAAIRLLRSQVQRIAPYFRTALILGETGSGKQLVARYLHARSPGAGGPFIVTTASALAESLAGDKMPGVASKLSTVPLLQSANGGTLYLKGVGDLSFPLQAEVLRFIRTCEDRPATPLADRATFRGTERRESGARIRPAHVSNSPPRTTRILVASDRDLRMLSAIGRFRQDLYARLAAVEISVPPLRQRVEDIPILAAWLLNRFAEESGSAPKLLAESTLAQLQGHLWPDNLRELEGVLAQAAALAKADLIEPRHLLALIERTPAGLATAPKDKIERLQDVVTRHVLEVLARCGGNKLRAAELLGISRSTLYRMLDTTQSS